MITTEIKTVFAQTRDELDALLNEKTAEGWMACPMFQPIYDQTVLLGFLQQLTRSREKVFFRIEKFFETNGIYISFVRLGARDLYVTYTLDKEKEQLFLKLVEKVFVDGQVVRSHGEIFVLVSIPPDFRICKSCGCSEQNAFTPNRYWVEEGLCNVCHDNQEGGTDADD